MTIVKETQPIVPPTSKIQLTTWAHPQHSASTHHKFQHRTRRSKCQRPQRSAPQERAIEKLISACSCSCMCVGPTPQSRILLYLAFARVPQYPIKLCPICRGWHACRQPCMELLYIYSIYGIITRYSKSLRYYKASWILYYTV